MPEMPRTKFNSPWTVANIEAELNGVKDARGSGTLSAALAAKVDSSDFTTDQQRQDALEIEDRAALVQQVDSGAKNLLEMTSTITTITKYGVTATYDKAAGTVTLTGTHVDGTSAAIFEFYSGNAVDQKIIPAGVYRLSGCPSGGSTSTFRGALTQIASGVDSGNGTTFTLTEPHYIAYRILISGNCDFTGGVVFRPMLCTAADYAISPAFVPYRPSWQELYEMILALQTDRSVQSAASLMRAGRIDASEQDEAELEEEADA